MISHISDNVLTYMIVIPILNGYTFLAIIFNFFIIPKIEKQVGEKLKFGTYGNLAIVYAVHPITKYFFKHFEIALAIIIFKFIGKPKKKRGFALEDVSYDAKTASCVEIIMSYIVIINYTFLFIAIGILGYTGILAVLNKFRIF